MPTARPGDVRLRSGADHCPGVLTLHAAEDGGLARVRLPGGRIDGASTGRDRRCRPARERDRRADLAREPADPGLPDEAGDAVADLLAEAGLLPSSEHELVRNVLASPLAGRHPAALAETDAIVAELDRVLCADPAFAALPGRFLFAVDDGSGLALGAHADVALIAEGADAFRLALAGVPTSIRVSAARGGRARAGRGARLPRLAATAAGRPWRVADLAGAASAIAAVLGGRIAPATDAARGA